MYINYRECRNAFFNGERDFKSGKFASARYWYKIAKQHNNYVTEAIYKLFIIETKMGRFDKARELLEKNYFLDTLMIERCLGCLDSMEFNTLSSNKHFEYCIRNKFDKLRANVGIMKNYYQLGDNDKARECLELVARGSRDVAYLNEASILYYEENYEQALEVIRKIDVSKLADLDLKSYKDLLMLLNYKLKDDSISVDQNRYFYQRLFDSDEKLLRDHIKKHFDKVYSDMGYFKDISVSELIDVCKSQIADMNGLHYISNDLYKFSLDKKIGFKSDEGTSDIEVVTFLDSKDILTIYPVMLSEEYDHEKWSRNSELTLKRERSKGRG